tara:strand:+ start:1847 stop:2653 length:807 start_codon:yes stop_codon:yes gene_type:complete
MGAACYSTRVPSSRDDADPHADVVRIQGLTVDCVVGLYPHERHASQPLQVDLAMTLDTEAAASTERVGATVDYAAITSQVVFLLRSCRFRLLETAAHVLARYLLAPPAPGEVRAALDAVEVRLKKPGALRGFATPSLTIRRTKAWAVFDQEDKPWGTVDIVQETKDAGIYRLNVAPGATIPLHVHQQMRESEMVLTKGILCQGEPCRQGTVHRWPRGAKHVYENPTKRWQSILCVDLPRFDPTDEVEVQGEPDDVPREAPWGPVPGSP